MAGGIGNKEQGTNTLPRIAPELRLLLALKLFFTSPGRRAIVIHFFIFCVLTGTLFFLIASNWDVY